MRRDALVMLLLALAIGSFSLWLVHQDVNSFTLQTFGDQAWVQASAQIGMQSGPFATNSHLGWDTGLNPWTFPAQGSVGFLVMAWLLGVVSDSSSNVLAGIMAVTAAAVGVATYAAVRLASPGRSSRLVAALVAVTVGASPYVLSKMGHYNVAALYLLPVVLAFLGLSNRTLTRRQLLLGSLGVAVVAAVSPLWWGLISLFLLALGLGVALVLRNRRWIRHAGVAFLAVGVGVAVPAWLALANRVNDDAWNRQTWDSTVFGGSLTDFVLGSPLLSRFVEPLSVMMPGTSKEFSQVGLIPAVGALVAVGLALTAYLGFSERTRRSHGWLFVAVQLTLLAFLALGLGTLAEATFVLVGWDFPLRVWSRLTILLALLGLIVLAPWVTRVLGRAGRLRGVLAVGLAVVVVGVTAGDAMSTQLSAPRTLPSLEEAPAVAFLDRAVEPCPVAQLPTGTFPDYPLFDGNRESLEFYYRGFVPYLLNPDFSWSYGAVVGTPTDEMMRGLPSTITPLGLEGLQAAGYCAVLFDRRFAEWLTARGTDWPATSIEAGTPDWQGDRFDVYLLD